jgi:hypothetical protein
MTAYWAPSVFKNAQSPNAADVSPTLPDRAPVPGIDYYQGQTESSIREYRDPAMELARQYYR